MTICEVLASLLLAAATMAGAMAQDTGTTPAKSPEVQALEARTAQLTAEAAVANAQAAVTNADAAKITAQTEYGKALVPTLPPGKAGTLTVSGTEAPVETAILAYQELRVAAEKIAGKVTCTENASLVIHSATELAGLTALTAFGIQVESLRKRLEFLSEQDAKIREPPPPSENSAKTAPIAASAAISAAIAIASLFRVDTKYDIKDISYDEKTLVALVAEALGDETVRNKYDPTHPDKKSCKSVYYPAEMPPGIMRKETKLQENLGNVAVLITKLREISLQRTPEKPTADKKVDQRAQAVATSRDKFAGYEARKAEIVDLEKKLAGEEDAKKKEPIKKKIEGKKTSLQKDIEKYGEDENAPVFHEQLKDLNRWTVYRDNLSRYLSAVDVSVAAGDAFLSAITKTDDGSGAALLSRLLRAERLWDLLEKKVNMPAATVLQLSVPKLGGTTKQDSSFFRNKVSFSGGAVVSYLQYRLWKDNGEADGAILTSGAIPVYSPFLTSNDILKKLKEEK